MAPSAESSASGAAAASASAPAYKRRRVVEEEPDLMSYEDDDDTYEAYIPASKRKQMELQRIAGRGRVAVAAPGAGTAVETGADKGGDDDDMGVRQSKTALLHAARELKALQAKEQKSEAEKAAEEERKILDAHAARRKLASDMELAKGISYEEPLKTSWRAPAFVRRRTEQENEELRDKHHVLAEGKDIPPLITNFRVSEGWRTCWKGPVAAARACYVLRGARAGPVRRLRSAADACHRRT
jgi:ATP-dependent RNA helicase DDX41